MRDFIQKHTLLCIMALAMVWALAFQGTRGLIEPDEGRYSNVALQILQHNDWISLYRNQDSLHFTKPPLTYWTMAASVAVIGHNEWAVRLPMALAFVLSVFLVYRLGQIFVPRRPWLPALLFLASPLAYLASNTINTDTLLAAIVTLGVSCYCQYRFASNTSRWLDAMWLAFGLAFLTKGPPGLLPLLAIIVYAVWHKHGLALLRPWGLLGFAIIGLGWYLLVILRHPGLLEYFLGHEVMARIASNTHNRNSAWYGAFETYVPVMLLAVLPALAAVAVYWRQTQASEQPHIHSRFLWLWLLLPLGVFFLAKSRLPLYILGLTVPAVLLLSRRLQDVRFGRNATVVLAVWLLFLLGIKGYAGELLHDKKDSRVFATDIGPLLPGKPAQFIFVEDMTRNGLNLYFDADIKKVSYVPRPKPISDAPYDTSLGEELQRPADRRIFIFKRETEARFLAALKAQSIQPVKLGEWQEGKKPGARDRMIYTLENEFVK